MSMFPNNMGAADTSVNDAVAKPTDVVTAGISSIDGLNAVLFEL